MRDSVMTDHRGPIRVLVVDDQPSMRRLIRYSLESDPGIDIVAEAGDARAARDAVNSVQPDVITLDVEMPGMNGLSFLHRLMKARPTPVVMISTLTERGSEAAVRALSLGAVDCIAKPRAPAGGELPFPDLAQKVREAACARVGASRGGRENEQPRYLDFSDWNRKFVLIGASTGGVEALETILGVMPRNCPPIFITQHMPAQFLSNFSRRLNANAAPDIRLAEQGDKPELGQVLVAPGGRHHLTFKSRQGGLQVHLDDGPKRSGHRPSVDSMFRSAVSDAQICVAVILTGMGRDGADGLVQLRKAGAHCVAQDRASSVVYGMPRMAVEMGGVDQSLPLNKIAGHILSQCSRRAQRGEP